MRQITRTLSQVRDLEVAQLGTKGIPNLHWPWTYGNDCWKFQMWALGIASRSQQANDLISIQAGLAESQWQRLRPSEIRAGDLVLQQWDDNPDVDHVGLCYSRVGDQIRTIEANTSPKPGIPLTPANRGIYDKTRPLGSWVTGGIRPPYKPEALIVPASKRAEVRLVLAYLDEHLPEHVARSKAGPHAGAGAGDGVMGPVAWLEVQEWGDLPSVGLYPSPPYLKDGVAGGRTKFVYGEALKRAKAAQRR
jgi:hypothetical protein